MGSAGPRGAGPELFGCVRFSQGAEIGNHSHCPRQLTAYGLQASLSVLPFAPAQDCQLYIWDGMYTNADDSTQSTSGSSRGFPPGFAVCEKWALRPALREEKIIHGCNR